VRLPVSGQLLKAGAGFGGADEGGFRVTGLLGTELGHDAVANALRKSKQETYA
jgi:hypothetical protein